MKFLCLVNFPENHFLIPFCPQLNANFWIMAAPGVTLTPAQLASFKYQQEHITEDRRGVLIGACSALWALALVALCLRFYAKKILRSKYEHDDGLIILGFVWCADCARDIS